MKSGQISLDLALSGRIQSRGLAATIEIKALLLKGKSLHALDKTTEVLFSFLRLTLAQFLLYQYFSEI